MFQRQRIQCSNCNKTFPGDELVSTCPQCNSRLTIIYDYNIIGEAINKREIMRRRPGVWKYFELLPVNKKPNIVSLGEGGTFLQKCDGLAKILGLNNLYVKNETTNPTGSFIDRGMTVLVSKALETNIKSLSCIPKGNLGASLAAYAAKSGLKCKILFLSDVDPNLGKLYQMIAFNANIHFKRNPKNNQNDFHATSSNPFLTEGEKTIAYEICEQFYWDPPSRIITPMGSGGLTYMIGKGLQELTQIGFTDQASSKITGVQAEGCSPIVEAYKNQRNEIEPFVDPKTFAIDIKVTNPPYGKMALKAI
ncbi:MAG: pyridoxal-phosphate dependent enzyme, partial [Candidatus Bathyarchaeota archaeon]